jgi:hypothetical protein
MAEAMASAMQPARVGGDPDDGVGRAIPRRTCRQHDPGDDEEDDAAERAGAESERRHDGDRCDEGCPKTAIKCSHVPGHSDHSLGSLRLLRIVSLPSRFHFDIGGSADLHPYFSEGPEGI